MKKTSTKLRIVFLISFLCPFLLVYMIFQMVRIEVPSIQTIILKGANELVLELPQMYKEAGAIVVKGTDSFPDYLLMGSVDSTRIGTYQLYYDSRDHKSLTKNRTVHIVDTKPPTMNLLGASTIELFVGDSYSEEGVVVTDNDPYIDEKDVIVSGHVDTSIASTYTLHYYVEDQAKQSISITRTITVKEKIVIPPVVIPPVVIPPTYGKLVYLTFDDGPSQYTPLILNSLAFYNARATFFVTGRIATYPNILYDTINQGHSIALHTYTHDYAQVYQSITAYFEDLHLLESTLYNLTGLQPRLIRFPGGTNNQVSQQYSPHIMQSIVQEVNAQGYAYTDWNVSSGDSSTVPANPEQIAYTVLNNIENVATPIVLLHDSKYNTALAVPIILEEGTARGYQFVVIDANTPLVHFIPR